MHQTRQKLSGGTAGQNQLRTRVPGVPGQGRGRDACVRETAHGDDHEDIVGRLVSYPLSLKVLYGGQWLGRGGEKGESGRNLRCFYRRSGGGGQS